MLMRGDRQFGSKLGITMLLKLGEMVVLLNCLANESEIPPVLLLLRRRASGSVDSSSPRWRFSEILLQYGHLNCLIRTGLSHEEAIGRAEFLDQELDRLSQDLFSWVPSNQCPVTRPDTTGELNRCPGYQTRRAWNNIRVLRILLVRIIREQSAPLLRKSAANASSAMEKLHKFTHISGALSLEICSSIPYNSFQHALTSGLSSVQVASLSFHLYVVKEAGIISDEMRQSILERMQALQQKQLLGHQRLASRAARANSSTAKRLESMAQSRERIFLSVIN